MLFCFERALFYSNFAIRNFQGFFIGFSKMTAHTTLQRIKPWIMPMAMLAGWLLHEQIGYITFLAPYLIFIMLLITFCKVKPREFRVTRFSWLLLAVQLAGSLALYFALLPISSDFALGAFICVFCPTATSAPVVTNMLGGSISKVATYSIISNISVALLAPVLFARMDTAGGQHIDMLDAMLKIAYKVVPLIILPLPCAFLLMWKAPRVHRTIATHQSLSFYIWAVALFIVVGRAVSYVVTAPASKIGEMVALALVAGVTCIAQFIIGRRIGAHCGDRIAGAQSLGQKNTVLAVWMAMTFFNPITSVAPAAYIVWQNTINSGQIFFKTRHDLKSTHP